MVARGCSLTYSGGGSLEPERSRLQCAMIVPLDSSLGNRVRTCLKTKQNKKTLKTKKKALEGQFLLKDKEVTEPT